jgi:hypothetical protein
VTYKLAIHITNPQPFCVLPTALHAPSWQDRPYFVALAEDDPYWPTTTCQHKEGQESSRQFILKYVDLGGIVKPKSLWFEFKRAVEQGLIAIDEIQAQSAFSGFDQRLNV